MKSTLSFRLMRRHSNVVVIVHYCDVIMGAIASQITTIVYSNVYSDVDRRKYQSSASLAFVWGIHRGPVNSPHKWPVTRKMFPFDDVIMYAHCLRSRVTTLATGPWTRSFDVFFDQNKRLSKQPRRRWFETPSRSLWRHCITIIWFS